MVDPTIQTLAIWLSFFFFVIGSVGGWAVIIMIIVDLFRSRQ